VHNTGAFELDGNATHQTTDDWDNVCHQVNPTACPSPVTNTNGATAVSWVDDGSLNASIFTGGGSKDPQDISSWAWKDGAGGLPDKDNLLHSFAARYSLAPNASTCPSGGTATCEVLFFGSDRYDNSGDAQQGFWFFQNPVGLGSNAVGGGTGFTGVHKTGDLLVISDFSNGGTTSTITVYSWDPTCKKAGGTCGDVNLRTLETSDAALCSSSLADTDAFCGVVNPSNGTAAPWSFTDKSGLHTYLNGEFYEGGINLSLLGLGDECFAAVASETRSSTSTTATLKDFVLGGFGTCGSTLTTTPKAGDGTGIPTGGLSIGTGTVTAKDSAALAVTGVQNWTGNFQFYLCGPIASPNTCDTGGVPIGLSKAVTQATVEPIVSDAATLTSAGRYCWRGDFTSTKTGVPNASDHSTGECFTVNPVTPTLDTAAVASPVNFGQAVQDNATLGLSPGTSTATQPGTNGGFNNTYTSINATNGAAAGGKITFTLLKANCTDLATGTGTNPQDFTPISGNGTYGPVSFTPDAPGTYHWKAQYVPAGTDVNNLTSTHNGSCNDTDEQVIVNQVQTTISTRQFVYPQDKTTIVAPGGVGGNLAGNVTFELYDTAANCATDGGTAATGLLYSEGPLAVSGATTVSKTTNNITVRVTSSTTVYWRVTYASTNQAQLGSSSACTENTAVAYTGNDTGISIP
jgi:hypothetical protein